MTVKKTEISNGSGASWKPIVVQFEGTYIEVKEAIEGYMRDYDPLGYGTTVISDVAVTNQDADGNFLRTSRVVKVSRSRSCD